jgi:hypothetical protein
VALERFLVEARRVERLCRGDGGGGIARRAGSMSALATAR